MEGTYFVFFQIDVILWYIIQIQILILVEEKNSSPIGHFRFLICALENQKLWKDKWQCWKNPYLNPTCVETG